MGGVLHSLSQFKGCQVTGRALCCEVLLNNILICACD